MNRYRPREFDEFDDAISLINEPLTVADAIPLRTAAQPRSLHADIALSLAMAEHLLVRLEGGVRVLDRDRATVRELWLATRRQRDALAAALRLGDGMQSALRRNGSPAMARSAASSVAGCSAGVATTFAASLAARRRRRLMRSAYHKQAIKHRYSGQLRGSAHQTVKRPILLVRF
jgi:hypothetical protein